MPSGLGRSETSASSILFCTRGKHARHRRTARFTELAGWAWASDRRCVSLAMPSASATSAARQERDVRGPGQFSCKCDGPADCPQCRRVPKCRAAARSSGPGRRSTTRSALRLHADEMASDRLAPALGARGHVRATLMPGLRTGEFSAHGVGPSAPTGCRPTRPLRQARLRSDPSPCFAPPPARADPAGPDPLVQRGLARARERRRGLGRPGIEITQPSRFWRGCAADPRPYLSASRYDRPGAERGSHRRSGR